jgi:O-antigen ligase/tetratricopeptide (TPR) repeat protein
MLTVIGLGQMVSKAPDTVYWSFQTDGQVFGPFICRNHFAFYVNLCVGLTAGLLMGTRCFLPAGPLAKSSWQDLFRDPLVLWLGTALGIMVAGLFGCLSRGGLVGLTIGGIVGLIVLGLKGATRWAAWGVVPLVAGLLVLWMGHDRISQRWEKILDDNAHGDARAIVWARTLPLVTRFPLVGSGLGTFGLVEPATRVPGDKFDLYNEHAHNDYLQLWIEGGAIQIVLAGIVIGLILFKGIRAVRRQPMSPNGRLALGGLIGFIAIVVHSFVDFGLHIPAVSLFTAIVAAMLVNLGEQAEPAGGPSVPPSAWVSWPLCILQAVALMAVALLLIQHGRAEEQAERFFLASRSPRAGESRRLDYLAAALAFAKEDRADLHLARADVLMQRWHRNRTLACATALIGTGPAPNLLAAAWIDQPAPRGWAAEPDLLEAHRHITQARRLSPLDLVALEKASLLAIMAGDTDGTDRALARVRQLSPSEPGGWFWAGQRAAKQGDRAAMCASWRQALRGSNRYLPRILRAVPDQLSPKELLDDVLPADPALIMKALDELSKLKAAPEDQTPYLQAALAALNSRDRPLDAEEFLLKARIYDRLNDTKSACAAYTAALQKQPLFAWRLEFCRYLMRSEMYQQAKNEVIVLKSQDQHNQDILDLEHSIYRKIAER